MAAAGQVLEGVQGYQEGQAAADVTRAQIGATKIQRDRDKTDLANEQRSNLARMRAIFSAQGRSIGGLQESLILKDQTYQDAVASTRLLQDYDFRLNTLRATRDNQKRAAIQTLVGSMGKAGITGLSTAIGVQNYQSSLLASPTGTAQASIPSTSPNAPRATGSAV